MLTVLAVCIKLNRSICQIQRNLRADVLLSIPLLRTLHISRSKLNDREKEFVR